MKRVLSFLCAFVMVLACTGVTTTKADTTTNNVVLQEGQVISLKNAVSGYFMNVLHGGTANGTQIDLYPWDNTNTMKFAVHANSDGSYMLSPLCASNKYVDIRRYGNPIADGQNIVVWGADGDIHKNIRFNIWGNRAELEFAAHPEYCISALSENESYNAHCRLVVRRSAYQYSCANPGTVDARIWIICDANGNPLNPSESVSINLSVQPRGQLNDKVCSNTAVNTILDYFNCSDARVSNNIQLSDTSSGGIARKLNEFQNVIVYSSKQIKDHDTGRYYYSLSDFAESIKLSLTHNAPCIVSTYQAKRSVFNYPYSSNNPTYLPGGHFIVICGIETRNGRYYVTIADSYNKDLFNLPGNKKPTENVNAYFTYLDLQNVYDYVRCLICAE